MRQAGSPQRGRRLPVQASDIAHYHAGHQAALTALSNVQAAEAFKGRPQAVYQGMQGTPRRLSAHYLAATGHSGKSFCANPESDEVGPHDDTFAPSWRFPQLRYVRHHLLAREESAG